METRSLRLKEQIILGINVYFNKITLSDVEKIMAVGFVKWKENLLKALKNYIEAAIFLRQEVDMNTINIETVCEYINQGKLLNEAIIENFPKDETVECSIALVVDKLISQISNQSVSPLDDMTKAFLIDPENVSEKLQEYINMIGLNNGGYNESKK